MGNEQPIVSITNTAASMYLEFSGTVGSINEIESTELARLQNEHRPTVCEMIKGHWSKEEEEWDRETCEWWIENINRETRPVLVVNLSTDLEGDYFAVLKESSGGWEGMTCVTILRGHRAQDAIDSKQWQKPGDKPVEPPKRVRGHGDMHQVYLMSYDTIAGPRHVVVKAQELESKPRTLVTSGADPESFKLWEPSHLEIEVEILAKTFRQ